MGGAAAVRPPAWYRAVAVLALLWCASGVISYLMQLYGEGGGFQMSEAQSRLEESTPRLVTAAYATAVLSGLAGSVELLVRHHWAKALYVVMLGAVLIQFGWVLLISDTMTLSGRQAAILPSIILLVAIFLVWFAHYSDRRGWLR
jgi:hypothetical protein